MEVLIEKIDDAVDIVATDETPYSAEQLVTAAYNLVFKPGTFSND